MLFGNFAESKRTEVDGPDGTTEWLVELPDAPPQAMRKLFEIMHCRFVPFEQGKIRILYDLITMADCYDSVEILRPLSHVWVDGLRRLNVRELSATTLLAHAWVYYSLGQRADYEQTGTVLVLDSVPADFTKTAHLTALPPMLLDNVRALRLQLLGKLLEPLYNATTVLLEGNASPLGICVWKGTRYSSDNSIEQEKVDCEQRLLGLLVRELHRLRLWPRPDVADVDVAPRVLYNAMRRLAQPRKHMASDNHRNCVLELEPGNLANTGDDHNGLKGLEAFRYIASAKEVEFMARFTKK
ncbi:uncharacterized protein B0I36DRAFT_25522 [Microdochium trichocladiopsis]|uniref:Uncharacterized protein n=1 Tax=Microdochium trichocladiopsis TaxID=1682393 RepID=A0A9P9BKN2_9PEZI|nr:uncharacterized protein B0I36DRAFT_25522 [Microdochium trichocladiopsis]KAH7020772.1 hypothetical protein B0I36DRAFT_25522 [Microdochium trichocladiopsis]